MKSPMAGFAFRHAARAGARIASCKPCCKPEPLATTGCPLRHWWRGLDSNQRRVTPTDLQSYGNTMFRQDFIVNCGHERSIV